MDEKKQRKLLKRKKLSRPSPCSLPPIPTLDGIQRDKYKNNKYLSFRLSNYNRENVLQQMEHNAKKCQALHLKNRTASKSGRRTPQHSETYYINFMKELVKQTPPAATSIKAKESIFSRIGSSNSFSELLFDFTNEVQENYNRSMASANVDEIFRSENECSDQEQLIAYPKRLMTNEKYLQLRKRLEHALLIGHGLVLRSRSICNDTLNKTVLFHVESFSWKNPIEVSEFRQMHFKSGSENEARLMQDWNRRLLPVLQSPKSIFAMVERPQLHRAVEALLSTMIQRLLVNNVCLFVDTLEALHETRSEPFFRVQFACSKNGIVAEPDFVEMEKVVVGVVDNIAECLQNVPRVQIPLKIQFENEYLHTNLCQDFMVSAKGRLRKLIHNWSLEVVRLANEFSQKYSTLINGHVDGEVETFTRHNGSIAEYEERIKHYQQVAKDVLKIPDVFNFSVIQVDCKRFKLGLVSKCKQLVKRLLQNLVSLLHKENRAICELMRRTKARLLANPEETEDLLELHDDLEAFKEDGIGKIRNRLKVCKERLSFLLNFPCLTEERMTMVRMALAWEERMQPIVEDCVTNLENSRERFEGRLQFSGTFEQWSNVYLLLESIQQQDHGIDGRLLVNIKSLYECRKFCVRNLLETVTDDMEALSTQVMQFESFGDLNAVSQYCSQLQSAKEVVKEIKDKVCFINKEEALLNFKTSSFPELTRIQEYLRPFSTMYQVVLEWKAAEMMWTTQPLNETNADKIEEELRNYQKSLAKLEKTFKKLINQRAESEGHQRSSFQSKTSDDQPFANPLQILSAMTDEITRFRSHLPTIAVFCNPGLRERHWQLMSKEANMELNAETCSSLKATLELKISADCLDRLTTISVTAFKEYSLEKALTKMMDEWNAVEFTFTPYRDTGVSILASVEHVQVLLDDHMTKVQAMKSSAFVHPILAQMKEFEKKLGLVQETLDEWLLLQASWLYLEPIFFSEDIMLQMPVEGKLFSSVDAIWRKLMKTAQNEKIVLVFASCAERFSQLKECNEKIEQINHGLNSYLEVKRLYFPRFFFLSNDEMLEILSETKDPTRAQPHLKKCFEGIAKLKFNSTFDILAMYSSEGEQVDLVKPIVTSEARGQVERWLLQVQNEMMSSVHHVLQAALQDYSDESRNDWILHWPGQVVLCASQIIWTKTVHACLNKGNGKLAAYAKVLQKQLNNVVSLVRGKLSAQARIALGALVVVDVHAKDVVDNLLQTGVADDRDFNWLAQLRYYWLNNECQVKITCASFKYACEYLGNSGRLVITPLTDRCYRTLMGAFHLHLNGAPEGPAGTGKTETTKDLAKALAVQCVVFNCSDGLDYLAMGKFFKGLASSGAWACFDEFNRIDLEVLSVVAQQILCISRAVQANVRSILFEGTELQLNPNCYVCITMNPGYAGRSELPDNLKVLFRTVAMMVPDYAMIGEIILYSYGFLDARQLAMKIVTTYRLCSEQLSSQSHYDYGMRAVKAVLAAAGRLKLKHPETDESSLVLKSILDINLPKFLSHDIPLFNGILTDLFPKISQVKSDSLVLIDAVKRICRQENLEPVDSFIEKVNQSYEMMMVRHGFMLVGQPYSGKTKVLDVLSKACSLLHKEGHANFLQVRVEVINPKALSMGRLFGQFDAVSHEWTDGVVAKVMRDFSSCQTNDRKWIVFDGPVDTLWIESMNTALDDNKKLCLMSGEIIQLSDTISMIFEVMDLSQASPATVSRCGMVYMEPRSLGWKPLLKSWINLLPNYWDDDKKNLVTSLISWLLQPCLNFVRGHCKEYVTTSDNNLANSMMHLMEDIIDDAINNGKCTVANLSDDLILETCLFAITWSVGATCDTESRVKFDEYLRAFSHDTTAEDYPTVAKQKPSSLHPPGESIYDYFISFEAKGTWKLWRSLNVIPAESVEGTKNLHQLIVSTADTARTSFFLDLAMSNMRPMMFVGPTGTGKSAYVKDKLLNSLPADSYCPVFVNFSARTSVALTQAMIESRLDKRRKNVLGPPVGQRCIAFVDDLNMPAKDLFGSQPPIELLRHFLDYGSWYGQKGLNKTEIKDLLLISAMQPPGGGRNSVTPRFLRHFHVMSSNPFSNTTLTSIFTTIFRMHLQGSSCCFDVANEVPAVVSATKFIYQSAKSFLLPTPSKAHYTFNLRDFSKVILGCCLMKPENLTDESTLIRLWVHEVYRVFHDRLLDDSADREWLFFTVQSAVEQHFRKDFQEVMAPLAAGASQVKECEMDNLMFGDYMDEGTNADDRFYREIDDMQGFHLKVEAFLAEYNSGNSSRLDLVVFRYVLSHLSRISRVLRTNGGHALLVGIGGSGRQSLTKLATHIAGYQLFQPKVTKNYGINDWREYLKIVLKAAGIQDKKVVLLLSDSQISDEGFLEDVDSLLNSGEVPNLFSKDEKQEIIELMQPILKETDGDLSVFAFARFVERCQENLHIIVSFSPVGDKFRLRLRMYPSLVNCCTIDWFHAWPDDALEVVSKKFLDAIDMPANVKDRCPAICKYFHKTAIQLSERFLLELGRRTYVTPSSYFELISSFKQLIGMKQAEVMGKKVRYDTGLDKISHAEQQINKLKAELEKLQPQLAVTKSSTEDMIELVANESDEAEKFRELVRADELEASKQAEQAQALKEECENDLAEAMPILNEALTALDTLKPTDITVVKSMKSPPEAVKLVLAAICVMNDMKPDRINDPSGSGMMINDYWGPSKRFLSDMTFLDKLKAYDKDKIPGHIISKVRKQYVALDDFKPELVAKASSAAEGLCLWVLAMDKYDKVSKIVGPKKIKLSEAEETLMQTMTILRSKQDELKTAEDKLSGLQQQLDEMKARKKDLEQQVDSCATKLQRAEQLIGGLGGEKNRWLDVAKNLQEAYDNLTGDVLICSAVIAYLGPFTSVFRSSCIASWVQFVSSCSVPCSRDFHIGKILASPTAIQAWHMNGLPFDDFSVENATIVHSGFRWPLLIDPQGQGKKWIKASENKLTYIKTSDQDYVRVLENCIQFGKVVLLEDIGEELDPILVTILNRETFKQGGVTMMNLGDKVIEFSDEFRLYLTTKMSNPHYLPDLSTKVSIINFMITAVGLEEQLLNIMILKESPQLERSREELIIQTAENNRALINIENKMLNTLSLSAENILEDADAIDILNSSKALSDEISLKQRVMKETEAVIEVSRKQYRPLANYSSSLFFSVSDMANIDFMYQYSLSWFMKLFVSSIKLSEKADVLSTRLDNIKDHFTFNLYCNVCRSLLEKDKLVLSFNICVNLMLSRGEISDADMAFFLTGGTGLAETIANPSASWMPGSNWNNIHQMSLLPTFPEALRTKLRASADDLRPAFEGAEPSLQCLPSEWSSQLTNFQRLLLMRSLRPDKIVPLVAEFVSENFGKKYVKPPPFNLQLSFEESSDSVPLIFILSPGVDPMSSIMTFADSMGITGEKFRHISLGQGQGALAEELIENGCKLGCWVVLQNCHLAESWLPSLEQICDRLSRRPNHSDFRLWLTSYPSSKFPIAVLQNGVKITNEPPSGLKMNLLQSYSSDPISNDAFFNGCKAKQKEFKQLLFSLCLFHAVVQERRKFGPQGWNNPYNFNESDLHISIRELQMYMNDYKEVPFDAIRYLIGECNYGGRVTDDFDRRCLLTLLNNFCSPKIITIEKHSFCKDSSYHVPSGNCSYNDYIQHIQNLPCDQSTEIFGMHQNINITKDIHNSKVFTELVLAARGKSHGQGGAKFDSTLLDLVQSILSKLPEPFDVNDALARFPLQYDESMNTVLIQEMERYNRLLHVIFSSLTTLKKAIKGEASMNADIEDVGRSITVAKIPKIWANASYPSNKPLGSYIMDFLARISFLQEWSTEGKPAVYWISGFFFTQAFLTGAMQNHARKYSIPVDQLRFNFEVLNVDHCSVEPSDGVYIHGLFLDCARWDRVRGQLAEQHANILSDQMPVIWLRPERISNESPSHSSVKYECPVYKTSERRGQLTTTGHSTNYVMTILLDTDKPASHWIKQGTALICQLDH